MRTSLKIHSRISSERVGDSGNDLIRSSSELQFSLLESSLYQLVQDSDVRRFFDSSPSLAVISFCSEMRQISLVARVLFVQGNVSLGRLIFVGPIGPSLSDFRLAFWLCLLLNSLKGSDLSLKWVVELPQCLLFTDDILAVEGDLLSIAIGYVDSSSVLSCWRAYEGSNFRTASSVGR